MFSVNPSTQSPERKAQKASESSSLGSPLRAPISPEPNPVNEGVSIINVHVPEQPSVGVTEIGITSETTIVELLHLFSQKHRLQLYTDSYIFYLNEEDQKRY